MSEPVLSESLRKKLSNPTLKEILKSDNYQLKMLAKSRIAFRWLKRFAGKYAILEPYESANKPILSLCLKCDNVCYQVPSQLTDFGCSKCKTPVKRRRR